MENNSLQSLKGNISISRPHGPTPPYVEIEVVDESSGSQFVSVRIGLEEFAELITGLSHVDCEFDFRPAVVGKVREHKEEVVPFETSYATSELKRARLAAKALAPFEVDGWRGSPEDLFNHHRGSQGKYRVRFVRYVEAKQ